MHIGRGKIGNVQRTYPFVTGRVFWGALTMRITRNNPRLVQANGNAAYQIVSEKVHQSIAYTYFYPARFSGGFYHIFWPWDDDFRRRLISSYVSTALSYPMQSAAEALLHEVEFITPYTLDSVEPVFFVGYIFVKENSDLGWEKALHQLQFGGERCYGWGDVRLMYCAPVMTCDLFGGMLIFQDSDVPKIKIVDSEKRLLAHTDACRVSANGDIEPLVGREWRSGNRKNKYAGQHVGYSNVCYTPGSIVVKDHLFSIGRFGVWDVQENPEE